MFDTGILGWIEGLSAGVLIVLGAIILIVGEVAKWIIRLVGAILIIIGAYELLTGLNFFTQAHL